jgi:hypothetical protein
VVATYDDDDDDDDDDVIRFSLFIRMFASRRAKKVNTNKNIQHYKVQNKEQNKIN